LEIHAATVVGSVMTFIVVGGIVLIIFSAVIASFGEKEVVVNDNSVLTMTLASDIPIEPLITV
jgi:hypothetical protein